MAFCKNCGTELKEGAVFCKNCGFKVGDKLAVQGAAGGPAPGASGTSFGISGGDYQRILKEKMRDKRFRMGVGAGAVLLPALIVIILVTGQMGKRIPLDECIIVEVSGYDSAGTAAARLDEEAHHFYHKLSLVYYLFLL